jgi:hypothetical protein
MDDRRFRTAVIIDLGADGDRDVKSVGEALDILSREWPDDRRGAAHEKAMRTCSAALAGRLPVEKARDAFSAAAWEARLFVSDIRRLSEALS